MTEVRLPEPLLAFPSDQDSSGRSLGAEELARLGEVIRRGTLTSTRGPEVPELEARFGALLEGRSVVACASGTAAVHAAVAAVDPEPGDEIVTTPITDMGALTPVLYQGAIPVFADVDATTGNVTAAAVERCLSDRTRAIVATHLFGNPCEVAAIERVAVARGIPLIEDCAQALLARSEGRLVGTVGDLACFSLQQGKHVTSGEGGLVATSDAALARRTRVFVNKGWPYGEPEPDHEFLALNGRMTELQAAVANAQLNRLEAAVAHRRMLAERLTDAIAGLAGVEAPPVRAGDVPAWWRYALLVDGRVLAGGPGALASELARFGVASVPRYIRKPAFRCRVFAEQRTFGNSRWPFTLARPEAVDYAASRFTGTFAFLDSVLVLPWNERLSTDHVDRIADALVTAVGRLAGGKS